MMSPRSYQGMRRTHDNSIMAYRCHYPWWSLRHNKGEQLSYPTCKSSFTEMIDTYEHNIIGNINMHKLFDLNQGHNQQNVMLQ